MAFPPSGRTPTNLVFHQESCRLEIAFGASERFMMPFELIKRYEGDLRTGLLEADYIVVKMARQLLGAAWLEDYVVTANAGGVERVLV
jgi:hypothetical protein